LFSYSLIYIAKYLTADIQAPGFFIGHHTVGSRDDGYPQSVQYPGKVVLIHILPQSGLTDSLY
jgi:hypothetical protein